MHRFFVAPELLVPTKNMQGAAASMAEISLSLPEKLAHQVRDVLHLGVGEQLVLLDNSGDEVLTSVIKSGRGSVEVKVLERRAGKSESPVRITLCQGLLKSARFEWILEKGTELGVSVFAPILCRRSMAGLEDAGPSKIQRWQRIIQEAAEQCGRSRLPELLPIRPLLHALNDIPAGALAVMPWEEEQERSLYDALIDVGLAGAGLKDVRPKDPWPRRARPLQAQMIDVVLFIGPEGGLTAEEVKLAQRYGVQVVTLGTRILRAETAALATVANVMFALEG